MDFKVFYFDRECDMWAFVSAHWVRVWNVCYIHDPDPGMMQGWQVRIMREGEGQ